MTAPAYSKSSAFIEFSASSTTNTLSFTRNVGNDRAMIIHYVGIFPIEPLENVVYGGEIGFPVATIGIRPGAYIGGFWVVFEPSGGYANTTLTVTTGQNQTSTIDGGFIVSQFNNVKRSDFLDGIESNNSQSVSSTTSSAVSLYTKFNNTLGVYLAHLQGAHTPTAPSGWTNRYASSNADFGWGMFTKEFATGTDEEDITYTIGSADRTASTVFGLKDADASAGGTSNAFTGIIT